jgi:hypothetical protein
MDGMPMRKTCLGEVPRSRSANATGNLQYLLRPDDGMAVNVD